MPVFTPSYQYIVDLLDGQSQHTVVEIRTSDAKLVKRLSEEGSGTLRKVYDVAQSILGLQRIIDWEVEQQQTREDALLERGVDVVGRENEQEQEQDNPVFEDIFQSDSPSPFPSPSLHSLSPSPASIYGSPPTSLVNSNITSLDDDAVGQQPSQPEPTQDPRPRLRRYEWSSPPSADTETATEDLSKGKERERSPHSSDLPPLPSTAPISAQLPLFRAPSSSPQASTSRIRYPTPPRTRNPYRGSPYPTNRLIAALPRTLDRSGRVWPTLILAE